MNKDNLEEEIEKTLNSVDHLKRVELPHLFYKKVQNRIAADQFSSTRYNYNFKPAFSLAALFIGVLLNIFAISKVVENRQNLSAEETSSVQSFAKDYDLNIYTVYDNKTGN